MNCHRSDRWSSKILENSVLLLGLPVMPLVGPKVEPEHPIVVFPNWFSTKINKFYKGTNLWVQGCVFVGKRMRILWVQDCKFCVRKVWICGCKSVDFVGTGVRILLAQKCGFTTVRAKEMKKKKRKREEKKMKNKNKNEKNQVFHAVRMQRWYRTCASV